MDLVTETTNPILAWSSAERILLRSVYSFLINTGPSFGYEPDLAVRWAQLNGTTWEFFLAGNAYFVDAAGCTYDGVGRITDCPPEALTPVTAEDVTFTFEYARANRAFSAYLGPCVEPFREARILGPGHVTIEFAVPVASALPLFTCVPILPRTVWSGHLPTEVVGPPVGSGPFLLRASPGVELSLDRNPFWHGPEVVGRQVAPSSVVYVSYTTSSSMVADLLSGHLDLAMQPTAEDWTRYLHPEPGILTQAVWNGLVVRQTVNVMPSALRAAWPSRFRTGNSDPLLRDHWVIRGALHLATDRAGMADAGWAGLADLGDTLTPRSHPSHLDLPPYSPDDKNGDGFPFDTVPGFPDLVASPDFSGPHGIPGVPALLEAFPDGTTDLDEDGTPDAIEIAKDLLHAAGWRYDCGTGLLDTPASPALPLCREESGGGLADPLRFLYAFPVGPGWQSAADLVVSNAARIGILLLPQALTESQMSSLFWSLDYDVVMSAYAVNDASDILTRVLASQLCGELLMGRMNENGFCPADPEGVWLFDGRYNATLVEADPASQRLRTDALQQLLYDFGSYNVPVYPAGLYGSHEVRWTNWGNWAQLAALPPDIGNPALLPQFVVPVVQKPPQIVVLEDLKATVQTPAIFGVAAIDPEGGGLTYRWDFDTASEPGGAGVNGDGILDNDDQASVPNPSWTYASVGTYGVAVRAYEDGGEWFSLRRLMMHVGLPSTAPPVILGIVHAPTRPVTTDSYVMFAAPAWEPTGADLLYTWMFGDVIIQSIVPNDPIAYFTFPGEGEYIVRVRVQGEDGRTVEAATLVAVLPNAPPSVTPLKSQVVGFRDTSFVAFASDPDYRDWLTFEWDFGDGTPVASGNPVTHLYSYYGMFTLSVTVRDAPGGHSVTSAATIIALPEPGSAQISSFVANPASSWTTLPIELRAEASDPQGSPLLWEWDFEGDGAIDKSYDTPSTLPGEPVMRQEIHRYETAGSYSPTLRVTTLPPPGYTPKTVFVRIAVSVAPNNAPTFADPALTVDASGVIVGQPVTFSGMPTDPDGDSCEYRWEFGDGSLGGTGLTGPGCGDPSPLSMEHTFQAPGSYLVALTAEDVNATGTWKGGTASATAIVEVVSAPVIDVQIEAPWTQLYVGQTMDLSVVAAVEGAPLAGADVYVSVAGGTVTPGPWGTTDEGGTFETVVRTTVGTGGTTIIVHADVSKASYESGSADYPIYVVPSPLPLSVAVSSKTTRMMSHENATIRVRLTSGGAGVSAGLLTTTSTPLGSFGPVIDEGDGNYSFRWTAPKVIATTYAIISVSAKAGGYVETRPASYIITVDPNATGSVRALFLIGLPDKTLLRPGETIQVRLYLYTIEGYPVAGAYVVATVFGGSAYGSVTSVGDELNGLYTFRYTAPMVAADTVVLLRVSAQKVGYLIVVRSIGLTVSA